MTTDDRLDKVELRLESIERTQLQIKGLAIGIVIGLVIAGVIFGVITWKEAVGIIK